MPGQHHRRRGRQGNTIAGNETGIEVLGVTHQGAAKPGVGGTVIQGNQVQRNFVGITFNNAADNSVIGGNQITANQSIGVQMTGQQATFNLVQGGNNISQNRGQIEFVVPGQAQPLVVPTGVGVYIERGSNNTVNGGNTISNNRLVGVYLFDRAVADVVTGNTINSNGGPKGNEPGRDRGIQPEGYGVLLYNSGGNVASIPLTANTLQGNITANYREFTGAVTPRLGTQVPTLPQTRTRRPTRVAAVPRPSRVAAPRVARPAGRGA